MNRQAQARDRFEDHEVNLAAWGFLSSVADEGLPTVSPEPVSQEELDEVTAALEIGRLKAIKFSRAAEERVRMIPSP